MVQLIEKMLYIYSSVYRKTVCTYGSVKRKKTLRPIYTWVRFRIRLAHFPKYKNNYILKNGLAYCEIALRNRTCKQAFRYLFQVDKKHWISMVQLIEKTLYIYGFVAAGVLEDNTFLH
jgi:hypothetical protein